MGNVTVLPGKLKSVLVQQAFTAIDAATTTDEVTKLLNEWSAITAYARKAKDKQLEADAAEIEKRAKRRLGEMMRAQKETFGLNKGGRPKTGSPTDPVSEPKPPTLAEAGIDKHLADSARKEAAKSEEQFEDDVAKEKAAILAGKPVPFVHPANCSCQACVHPINCSCRVCKKKRGEVPARHSRSKVECQQHREREYFGNTVATIDDVSERVERIASIPVLDAEQIDNILSKIENARTALANFAQRFKDAVMPAAEDAETSAAERKVHYVANGGGP